jgi:hypothetical protein
MAIRSFPKINYDNIVSEALHLRVRWIQMKQLVAQSQDRVDCMNWYASSFFGYVDLPRFFRQVILRSRGLLIG